MQPLGKRILVQPITKKKGIILTDEKPSHFKVLAIGDEVTKLKIDDLVFFVEYHKHVIPFDGQDYTFVDESNVIAKI